MTENDHNVDTKEKTASAGVDRNPGAGAVTNAIVDENKKKIHNDDSKKVLDEKKDKNDVDICEMTSRVELDKLLVNYPDLRVLADEMIKSWSSLRREALELAVHGMEGTATFGKIVEEEFRRHVAETKIPTLNVLSAMRQCLLVNRSLTKEAAREITVKCCKERVPESVIVAVMDQIMKESETLIDIAKGVGYPPDYDESKNEPGVKVEKIPLGEKDKINFGFLMMPDVSKLILIEIAAMRDVTQPCSVCKTLASKVCSLCSCVFYCSKQCQNSDWLKQHKTNCKPIHKHVVKNIRHILAQEFNPIVITFKQPKSKTKSSSKSKITSKPLEHK